MMFGRDAGGFRSARVNQYDFAAAFFDRFEPVYYVRRGHQTAV